MLPYHTLFLQKYYKIKANGKQSTFIRFTRLPSVTKTSLDIKHSDFGAHWNQRLVNVLGFTPFKNIKSLPSQTY